MRLLLPKTQAASLCRIHADTVEEWMRRGAIDVAEGRDTIEAQFSLQVKEAEAEGVMNRLNTIDQASKDSWQAAAWTLERLFPEQFARADRTPQTGAAQITIIIGQIVSHLAEIVPDPDLRLKLADAIEKTETVPQLTPPPQAA